MLVGRTRELDAFDALLAGALAGRGALCAVHGAPGIGKTRLADEVTARAEARGFIHAWGRAWETGGAPAYWPWIEALGRLADALPSSVPYPAALGRLLRRNNEPTSGTVERTRADPARERFELFEKVGTFLRAAAQSAPLLIVLDDIHAADVPSLELLAFVARGLRTTRIAIVASYRDVEARQAPVADVVARIAREAVSVAVGPLSNEAVAEVVRHEIGQFDGRLAATLHDLTEGNPLFLRETLHALATDTARSFASERAMSIDELRRVALSGGVMAVARGRLAGASESSRTLLENAAAIGRSLELGLFAETTDVTPADARKALEEGVERGLLLQRGDDKWLFAHVLVREALYEELTAERRRAIHARIAQVLGRRIALGKRELVATLAHHALASLPTGAGGVDDVVRIARTAAEHAREQLAYEEAIALLERARIAAETFGADERERAEILLALGWASTEAGQLARGRDLFREVATIARRMNDARLLARAALGQGGEYVLAEIRSELVNVLREALAALPTTDADAEDLRLRARVTARLAAALTPNMQPAEALALAREARAMTSHETDVRTRVDVDVGVGSALTDFAPPDERIVVNTRLLKDARDLGDRVLELRGLTRLSCDHLENGDVASADAMIAARTKLANEIGLPRHRWQSPLLRSMRAMPHGRWRECDEAIAEARAIATDEGKAVDPNAERNITVHQFFLALVMGRPERLRSHESEMQRVTSLLPDGADYRHWITSAVLARTGEHEAARRLVIGEDPLKPSARMCRALSADSAVLSGVHGWFETLYASLLPDEGATNSWGPFGFTCGPPVGRILAGLAFGLGRDAEAERHCERALALSERMGAIAHLVWVHLTWGEGLHESDPSRAKEHLAFALEHGSKLEMPEVVMRAERAMPSVSTAPTSTGMTFRIEREGVDWRITRGAQSFSLRDLRGVSMLARLVESPGKEVHALDLASDPAASSGKDAIDVGDAGEVLDPKARARYKQRIVELREDIDEAERFSDLARRERLQRELDALTQQIAAAVGLGGRERRAGSAAEKARVTVARRVREAIKKIGEHDADLGRHLDWTIRTGLFSAYEPEGRKSGR